MEELTNLRTIEDFPTAASPNQNTAVSRGTRCDERRVLKTAEAACGPVGR
jgi:hypothetical protein